MTAVSSASSIDESARRQFEAAWRSGQAQDLEQYLPDASNHLYLATLEELVHIELEFGWKVRGGTPLSTDSPQTGPPLVEHYVNRFAPLNQPQIILRLLRQECAVRRQCGHAATLSELRARFPQNIVGDSQLDTLLAPGA